jgi:hypothetical protein
MDESANHAAPYPEDKFTQLPNFPLLDCSMRVWERVSKFGLVLNSVSNFSSFNALATTISPLIRRFSWEGGLLLAFIPAEHTKRTSARYSNNLARASRTVSVVVAKVGRASDEA